MILIQENQVVKYMERECADIRKQARAKIKKHEAWSDIQSLVT